MSTNQALIRTQATDIAGAQYLNTPNSLLMPQAPVLNKAYVREYLDYTPDNGVNAAQPGVTVTFTQRRDYDVLNAWHLRWIASALVAPVGPITFNRWVDFLGFAAQEEVVIQSGTQRLQTMRGIEQFVYLFKCGENEQQQGISLMVYAGTPAFRAAQALADREVVAPMFTALGVSGPIFMELSQGLYVRGLNDLLTVRWQIPNANTLVESDGALQAAPAAGFFQNGVLFTEGSHVNRAERRMLATFYKQRPFSITFDDQQFSQEENIVGTTGLPFTQNFRLTNINQPVSALVFLLRWADDLTRVTNGANGTRGRNRFNIGGVYNPGGGSNGIVDTIRVRTGNNDIIATFPVQRLLDYQHVRDFKGNAGLGLPAVSFSRDFCMKNAVLGFIGFDQIEQPNVTIQYRVPTLGAAFATFNAAATADIGGNSDLRVQVLGYTKNQIDQASFLLSRPFG